ncbi:TonB-dependent receptor [Cyclobacterium qasimii]|uniref:TonB-dependent receptor n=2 Tax=Cyclobacterium qasimii TaxID=1350429 RepID=S7V5F4_9BACT|nr:TonB-dependent receptor [Cyclobacterium qasimii]EPR65370.1 TonB-dependent receptor [Cyclobacterium qasimii M12-11B]GEO20089.1 hypothetical protein CQA01_06230 [Cyclobacterium qasimii]
MNKTFIIKLLYSLLLFAHLAPPDLFGQGTPTSIKVIAASDQLPIIGATIQLTGQESPKGWVTDAAGTAVFPLLENSEVNINYLGFIEVNRIVKPGSKITISLEEDLLGLNEVVVTGAFAPTTMKNSLYQVKKFDAALIEARGAVNLSDVLQTQLNLKTIQDDVLGTRIVMQGISGPNVKILIDGIPLVNGSGGEFDLSQINMNNVERVEIVEGPLSVQYGTNALAGTINVITKDPTEETLNINSSVYYESVGQYNADLSLARGWKNTSISMGGSRNQFNGFSSTEERKENWIPRTQYLANVKLKTKVKRLNLTTAVDKLWQNSTSHGNATRAFNNRTNKISDIANDNYNNTERLNASLVLEGKLSDKGYLNLVNGVSLFEQSSRKYLQDIIDDIKWLSSDPEDHDTTRFDTWTFRGTYVYGDTENKQGIYLTTGYEASLNYATGGRISANAKGNVNEYGLFSALEIPLSPKFKIQPSFRYTYSNSYDTREIDFLNAGLPLLPSLNVMYKSGENLDFRFSYGQGYRTPSVRELYYEFIDANHYIVGNKALKPEVGSNLNASGTLRKDFLGAKAAFTTSLFFSKIDNKIDLIQIADREDLPDEVPKTVPVARVYENIPNFKSYGINLTAEMAWSNGFRLNPGLGLLARSGSEADDRFYNSIEANVNASHYLKNWDTKINLFYKYNGAISEFSRNQDGSIGVLTLDTYHTMDLSLSKPFLNGRLFTTMGAKNLFDVTDIGLSGEGSKGLVLQTGREAFYPISWGRTIFIKINYLIN